MTGARKAAEQARGEIWVALSRASAAQEYCGVGAWGREDVRIVSPIVEALGSCGIRVSGMSEGPVPHRKDDNRVV